MVHRTAINQYSLEYINAILEQNKNLQNKTQFSRTSNSRKMSRISRTTHKTPSFSVFSGWHGQFKGISRFSCISRTTHETPGFPGLPQTSMKFKVFQVDTDNSRKTPGTPDFLVYPWTSRFSCLPVGAGRSDRVVVVQVVVDGVVLLVGVPLGWRRPRALLASPLLFARRPELAHELPERLPETGLVRRLRALCHFRPHGRDVGGEPGNKRVVNFHLGVGSEIVETTPMKSW